MASGSLKDTARALSNVFSTAVTVNALPKETARLLDTFLQKHTDIDEHDSQRLQEELLGIHAKYIVKDEGKLGSFLHVLQTLRPAIRGQAQLHEWWTVIVQPVIDGIGHTRVEIANASDFLLAVLVYDEEDDQSGEQAKISAHFARLLLEAYLKRTRVPDPELVTLGKEDDFIAQQLVDVLVGFGRKKPKDFMIAMDRLMMSKDDRMQALTLLSVFVRHQPPHLYLVTQTPLIEHLLQCLLVDTSTTIISLALTTLIMFLPHIPSSVRTHLPRLFLIYSRLLCWERYSPSGSAEFKTSSDDDDDDEDTEQTVTTQSAEPRVEEAWEKVETTFDTAESTTPELIHYFTFLYGLYPLNFTSYIRKPRKYLKNINFPRADEFDLDQKVIRSRSEQFSSLHVLHSNFTTTTVEDELTENRWLKSDPAEVVAECINLYIAMPTVDTEPDAPSSTKLSDIPPAYLNTEDIPPQSLLEQGEEDENEEPLLGYGSITPADSRSTTSWQNTQTMFVASPIGPPNNEPLNLLHRAALHSQGTPGTQSPAYSSPITRGRDNYGDSPTLGTTIHNFSRRASRSQRNGSISSYPSGVDGSPRSDAMQTLPRDQLPRSPALRAAPQAEANTAFLLREVALLRNDLNLERYLKQQHQVHIGQLQRRHIKESTIEAETQNLINTNRTLKNKLVEANKAFALLKKETGTNRNQSKKWEADLTTRVRSLKDDERQWRLEKEGLSAEIDKARTDRDHLRQLVVDSEAKELLAQQEVTSANLKLEQLGILQQRLQELDDKVHGYEAREMEYEEADHQKAVLATELDAAKMRLQSRDADYDREKRSQNQRIRDLEGRLVAAQNPSADQETGQLAPQVQYMLDQTTSIANARYAALKKEHVALQHRFLALEIRCSDLEQEAADAAASASAHATNYSRHQSASNANRPSSQWMAGSVNDGSPLQSPMPIPGSAATNTSAYPSGRYEISAHRVRSEAPSRPTTSPSLDLQNLGGSPGVSAGTSAPAKYLHTPPLPPPPTNYSHSGSSPLGSPPGRTLHRTGTLSPSGSQHRATSPMTRSITGESMRSRPDSSMIGPDMPSGSGFYKNSKSAFSQDSLESVGSHSQGSTNAKWSATKNEARVYGRGGTQNSGKNKEKDEDQKRKEKREKEEDQKRKEKREKSKPGGLLGIRGIL